MANSFAHIELNTDDALKAKRFYRRLFPSWNLVDMMMPSGTYTAFDVGVKGPGKKLAAGGGIQKKMPSAPTGWMPYVEVPDVAKGIAKAAKLGATVIMPTEDIGMGKIAIFSDPTGAFCGLWAPAPKKPAKKKAAKKVAKRAGR